MDGRDARCHDDLLLEEHRAYSPPRPLVDAVFAPIFRYFDVFDHFASLMKKA
jgi:hypothetical protein